MSKILVKTAPEQFLETYFRELEKVPVLVSNFGNQKIDELFIYTRNLRREKERRKKERKKGRRTNKRKKERQMDKQQKERRTDEQKKERKTKRDRLRDRQRDRQTTDRQKERLNFSVFPGIREHIFRNKLSVPIFGKKKLKLPDLFSKTGTRKLWSLVQIHVYYINPPSYNEYRL